MRQRLLLGLCLLGLVGTQAQGISRVVIVNGALTEIVYALQADNLLVGTDTTSYWPPAAAKLPKVGYMRALSAEGVLSLNPDLVIATTDAGPPSVIEQIKSINVALLTLKPSQSLNDVKEQIRVLADVLDKRALGQQLIDQMTQQEKELNHLRQKIRPPKNVLFLMNHGGAVPIVAGKNTAADSIITLSGGQNIVQDYTGYKPLTAESTIAMAPDIILTTTQSLHQMGGEQALWALPGLKLTPAAKTGRMIAMDALLLLGFGPRTIEAALELNQNY